MSTSKKYGTSFQDIWLSNPDYKSWLSKTSCDKDAFCKLCHKKFSISAMGESAVKSHAKGKFHLSRAPDQSIVSFFSRHKQNGSAEQNAPSFTTSSSKDQRVDSIIISNETAKAEIMWALKVVIGNFSLNSCQSISNLFAEMFKCPVADSFKLSPTKCRYMICYGLAPYFSQLLLEELNKSLFIATSFDECFNRINQKGQMDFIVRYWSDKSNQISTRYLCSSFMGKASANDVLEHFNRSCSKIEKRKLIQVSSDGPNVNLKFLDLVNEDRCEEELPDLISIGTCGLHTIHRAFQHSAKIWSVGKVLRAMWKILDQSPSRRADYEKVTNSSTYPLQFCSHRWVENENVAKRAESIWDNFVKLINHWKSLPRSKQPDKENKSYLALKEAVDDPLIKAKFKFFEMVARHFNYFLVDYQTDHPMVPFLASDIAFLCRNLLTLFIRKSVLEDAKSFIKLSKIDPLSSVNLKQDSDVDIGFGARALVVEGRTKALISNTKLVTFQKESKTFLGTVCHHIIEKSPMKSKFARNASCIDPKVMASECDKSIRRFSVILEMLVHSKQISAKDADESKIQFQQFLSCDVKESRDKFLSFNRKKERLDVFLYEFVGIGKVVEYGQMWKPIQFILTMFHGQADVERGFNVNKELLVENLQEESLIAQRRIYDHMKSNNIEPHTINITKEILTSVKGARMKYGIALEEKRKEKSKSEKEMKRKQIDDDIADVLSKKRRLLQAIEKLSKDADQLAKEAESKQDFTLLMKSNSFRSSNKKKQADVETLEGTLKLLMEKKNAV